MAVTTVAVTGSPATPAFESIAAFSRNINRIPARQRGSVAEIAPEAVKYVAFTRV
jgi:hypothetical protein